jgi:hypothetical protein
MGEAIAPGNPVGAVPATPPSVQPQPGGAANNVWGPEKPATPAVPAPGGGLYSIGPCDEVTGNGYCCPNDWYLDQRVRFMYHPKVRNVPLGQYGIEGISQEIDPVSGGIVFVNKMIRQNGLTTRSVSFDPSAGYDVTFGHFLGRDSDNRDQFLEFTYYGGNQWRGSAGLHTANTVIVTNTDTIYPNSDQLPDNVAARYSNLFSLFSPDVAGFSRATDQDIQYTSRFDNFELNLLMRPRPRNDRLVLAKNGRWRREAQTGCFVSYLLGARELSLDEYFRFDSAGTIDYSDRAPANTSGAYAIRTSNDFYGLQAGVDCTWRKGLAEAGIGIKGGAFINFADQNSTFLTTGAADDLLSNGTDYSERRGARSRDVAGVAELDLGVSYHLRPNMVVRASYDLMWVSGVALAPEQLVFVESVVRTTGIHQQGAPGSINSAARIDSDGLIFMQSLSLGLEVNW